MKKRLIPILLLAFIVLIVLIILLVHFLTREDDSISSNSPISSTQLESYRDKEIQSIEYFESITEEREKDSKALEKELEKIIGEYESVDP